MTRELDFAEYRYGDFDIELKDSYDMCKELDTELIIPSSTDSGEKCRAEKGYINKLIQNLSLSDSSILKPTPDSIGDGRAEIDESDESRTDGSWDLPAGPVPWQDRDTTFCQVLQYADLVLNEDEENGLLTDRIVAACSSYLARSPASKCYIAAKLCLSNKNLNDIRIIAHHRFLQYIDFSYNNIKDLTPLGNLPYLMYLDVSHNLLEDVLRFKPPWNLTYVDYSYNEVWYIDDLSEFWSLSYLDLSHNKITKIRGLDTLRYLRHLNLSHNKITRFENLNHTKITDLNIEYNLISSFESGNDVGVKTMLSLNSLCLGNNLISELDFLSGCYHLRKLELQNNRVESLLELSNLRSVRKINLLDLTGNPVCENKSYRNLMLHAVPDVKYLDHSKVHLSEKVGTFLEMPQLIRTKALKSNWRMMLMDNLNENPLTLDIIPIDQATYPFVILVGPCASGKKRIVSKLGHMYPDKIFIGKVHTTRDVLESEKSVIKKIGRKEFEERIQAGQYYAVTETLGHYYGISKKMLAMAVKSHKLCLTYTDLEGALMIYASGLQPVLVLTIPKSNKEHEETLKKNYGPVVTLTGAAYINKRELLDSHSRNRRRVKEIIYDILQDIVFWTEYRRKFGFGEISPVAGKYLTTCQRPLPCGIEKDNFRKALSDSNSGITNQLPQTPFARENGIKNDTSYDTNSHSVCDFHPGLLNSFRGGTDYSYTSEQNSYSDENVREDSLGTCSTSYSAIPPKAVYLDQGALDDEGSIGEEDDLFVDWSSPFMDWDEINKDCAELAAAAEELSLKFVNRVLDSRSVYMDVHLNNPGMFSYVLFIENEEEALKSLTQFLKKIWLTFPSKQPFFHMDRDYAYKELVPRRLEKLKAMLQEEAGPLSERSLEKNFPEVRSPRTIITQMQMMGFDDVAEMV